MARHKDANWTLPDSCQTWEQVNTCVLMDLRDELKELVSLMRQAGHVLHAVHRDLTYRPRISRKQAARVLARARNRKRPKP